MRRLTRDIARRPLSWVAKPSSLRRTTMEIQTQMSALGYWHRIEGRPMPDEELPRPEVVTDRVLDALHRNPYTKNLSVGRGQVMRTVIEDYTGVERWPFRALVD
jgi:hypothetical protein